MANQSSQRRPLPPFRRAIRRREPQARSVQFGLNASSTCHATMTITRATDPAKPIQTTASSHKEKDKSPVVSPDLSPERFADRASTATKVLTSFLEQDDRTHYLRHWGINE